MRETRRDALLPHLMPTWLFCYGSHLASCFSDGTRCPPGPNHFRLGGTPAGSFLGQVRVFVLVCLASSSSSLTHLAEILAPVCREQPG